MAANIPHPQIVPIPHDGRTRYLLITFDGAPFDEPVLGYGTHDDLIVMRVAERARVRVHAEEELSRSLHLLDQQGPDPDWLSGY